MVDLTFHLLFSLLLLLLYQSFSNVFAIETDITE